MNVIITWVRVLLCGIMEASEANRNDAAQQRSLSGPVFGGPYIPSLFFMEFTHNQWAKVDRPDILTLGFESHIILHKRLAHEPLCPAPANFPVSFDPPSDPPPGVFPWRGPGGQRMPAL